MTEKLPDEDDRPRYITYIFSDGDLVNPRVPWWRILLNRFTYWLREL